MEGLIQLVSESFVRHGLEPAAGESPTTELVRPAEAPAPPVLPEHNYRKRPDSDLAP